MYLRLRGLGVIIFTILVVVAIVFIIQVLDVKLEFVGGIIIGILAAQVLPAWKYLTDKKVVNPRIMPYTSKQTFKAGIIHNKGNYIRGSVDINFKTEYTGKLNNGYFVNEITSDNKFPVTLPHVSDDFSNIKSYCLDTIDILNSKNGNLNGWREFSYTWTLDSQSELPVGKYKVKCMVFNEKGEKPLFIKEDSFEVFDMFTNAPYQKPNTFD